MEGMLENRLNVSYVAGTGNLHFIEKFTLVDQPGFKSIGLPENVNAKSIGHTFALTHLTKYYLTAFPFLSKLNLSPFLHGFAAFIPSNLSVTETTRTK